MLKVSNIELPDTAISAHRCEDVPFAGKVNIIYLFVMSDELRENSRFFNIPNGAGGVNRRRANQVVQLRVPIERSKRSREVVVLLLGYSYILEVKLQTHLLVVFDLPNLEALAWSSHQIGLITVLCGLEGTSSGMNMSFVGGYSWGKTMRLSRSLLSLGCKIST